MAAAKGNKPPTKGLAETKRRMVLKEVETRKELSVRTGISESKLSKIWNLQALPNRTEAVAIWSDLGVDPGLWDQPEAPDTAENGDAA